MTPDVETFRTSSRLRDGDRPEEVRLRVLFIDGSVVLRTSVKELFKNDASMEAFTSAPSMDVALLNIAKVRPHLAVIDADQEWTEVASLLDAIQRRDPELPLVFITAQESGRQRLLESGKRLKVRGCWLKANGLANPDASVRQYLIRETEGALGLSRTPAPSVEDGIRRKAAAPEREKATPRLKLPIARTGIRPERKSVVVIGVSTGGPEALSVLLPMLPAELKVPVLIVQHTLAAFTALLVERLQKRTALTVVEAQDGTPVLPGQVVVAPGNRHMQVAVRNGQTLTLLDDGPPENSCRPAVDPLFRSAARVYGSHALGVILTGMGQDGLAGCRDLKRAGGTILAQDQASSTVWGMPGQVAQAGLADKVLDLKDIADEILRNVGIISKARSL